MQYLGEVIGGFDEASKVVGPSPTRRRQAIIRLGTLLLNPYTMMPFGSFATQRYVPSLAMSTCVYGAW